MAERIMSNGFVSFNGLDLSGVTNEVELTYGQELVDATVINSNARSHLPSFRESGVTVQSFFDGGESTSGASIPLDGVLNEAMGTTGTIIVGENGASTGQVTHFVKCVMEKYGITGSVGELTMQPSNFLGINKMVRGQSGFYTTALTDTSTAGPAMALGAVTSGQELHAAWHLLRSTALSGDDGVTVVLVSSTESATFAASTTRLSFTASSTRTGEMLTVSGPITDTAFRFQITTTIAGNYDVLCVAGVD